MKKTKRNKRKLDTHLKMARFSQNLDDPEGKWRNKDGRPVATLDNSKEAQLINEWMVNHPESSNKAACARNLGMSRTTVTKWWKKIEERILDNPSSIVEFMEQMEPISLNYQHVYTSEEFKDALLNPDGGIARTVVPIVPMAKLFAPNSDFAVSGYTHEEVIEIVTTGKWQELGWDLQY